MQASSVARNSLKSKTSPNYFMIDSFQAGIKYLGALPEVDPKRIGIHGLSYGGLNAMQASESHIITSPSVFQIGA